MYGDINEIVDNTVSNVRVNLDLYDSSKINTSSKKFNKIELIEKLKRLLHQMPLMGLQLLHTKHTKLQL